MSAFVVDPTQPHALLREPSSELLKTHQLRRINVKTADGDPDLDLAEISKGYVKQKMYPLFQLYVQNKRYFAVRPIIVHIYHDDGMFFAENETLLLTGMGVSVEEAVYDLEQHIVYFSKYYRELSKDKLIGDAIRLKEIYFGLLAEK
jgi:hypothetical protein